MILQANPMNPAEFFGACGLFELISDTHPSALARWVDIGLEVVGLDRDLADAVLQDFCQAKFVPAPDWADGASTQPFALDMRAQSIYMDWWERRDGTGNSPWKCFGGRQRSLDAQQLLDACRSLFDDGVRAENCLQSATPLSGRLGFDPRSAWSSLNTGFSPNDLGKKYSVIPTFPFTELLTPVVAQRWPARFYRGTGTYVAWRQALPRAVARVASSEMGDEYEFSRIKRGQGISAFTFSRPTAQ